MAWCTGPIPILNEYHPLQNQSRRLLVNCFKIDICAELCNKHNKHFVCCEPFFKDWHTNVIMFDPQLEVIIASIKCGEPEVEATAAPGMIMFTV